MHGNLVLAVLDMCLSIKCSVVKVPFHYTDEILMKITANIDLISFESPKLVSEIRAYNFRSITRFNFKFFSL